MRATRPKWLDCVFVILCGLLTWDAAAQGYMLDDGLTELVDELNGAIVATGSRRVIVPPFIVPEGEARLGLTIAAAVAPYVLNSQAVPASQAPSFDGSPAGVRALSHASEADAVVVCHVNLSPPGTISCVLVEGRNGKVLQRIRVNVPSEVLRGFARGRKKITTEAAVDAARRVTDAVLDGNMSEVSKMFTKYQRHHEVVELQQRLAKLEPVNVRALTAAPRQMSKSRAFVTCGNKTFVIMATIRDDDHRLVEWSSERVRPFYSVWVKRPDIQGDTKLDTVEFFAFIESLHRTFPIDTRYLPRVQKPPSLRGICGPSPIQAVKRTSGPPIEVVAVFLVIDGLNRSVGIRVDVSEDGRIVTWGVLPADNGTVIGEQESSTLKPAPQAPQPKHQAVPQKEVVRSTLQRNVAVVRVDGRRVLESLREYGVDGEAYVFADEAIPAVEQVSVLTANALAAPELEPLRRWMSSALDTARPVTVKRTMLVNGQEIVYRLVPVAAIKKFKTEWEERLAKLEKIKDIAPDITLVSEPATADFRLFIDDDVTASYRGQTNDIVKNVYRGFYDLVVEKNGHKPCKPCKKAGAPHTPCLDLVDDPRTTIKCELVREKSGEECTCRRE